MKKFLIFAMSFVMLFCTAGMSVFASESNEPMMYAIYQPSDTCPSPLDEWDMETFPYALIWYDKAQNKNYFYVSTQRPYFLSNKITLGGSYEEYRLKALANGTKLWSLETQSDNGITLPHDGYDTVVWSSHDIKNSSTGEVVFAHDMDFFPITLAELIQGKTSEAITEQIPRVAGTMKILMVCGVGCLALLTVLKLFGKRSLLYRG